jgi:uncharacterized membrane protein YdcZ (DUF606 family)
MSDEFSIRMDSDDGIAPPMEAFQPRPDVKGPKTIAILLILGGILLAAIGYGDLSLSLADDLAQEEVDLALAQPRSGGENITDAEYQQFHDDARDSGAYTIRGASMFIGGIFIFVGGVLLFRLHSFGAKLASGGAGLSFAGGVTGSWLIKSASTVLPSPTLQLANEIMVYLCGTCTLLCFALAILPLFNAAARAALNQNVSLTIEEE